MTLDPAYDYVWDPMLSAKSGIVHIKNHPDGIPDGTAGMSLYDFVELFIFIF